MFRLGESVAKQLSRDTAGDRVFSKLLSPLVPPERMITVHDVTLEFRVADFQEYRIFQTYPERRSSFPVLPDVLDTLRPDDVFWDIGANVGIYTCFAAEAIDSGRVVSVEPNPNNVARIEDNLSANGLSAETYQYAMMSTPGELTLDIRQSDTTAGSYGSVAAEGDVTVEATTGDRLVERDVPEPNVIKMDVEGAELEVLRGLERAISRDDCRVIYCNVFEEKDGKTREVAADERAWLRENGFETETIWEWSSEEHDGEYVRAERR